ncbi:hypothetical protein ACHAQA_005897 [Verticillium albo-atrum]
MAKGKATLQDIRPSEFLDAFDNLFCPFVSGNSTISRYCEAGQARHILTSNLWTVVYQNYYTDALESSIAVDTLRNIYATALFLYNPVYRGAVLLSNGLIVSRTAQEGLADENYFPGSAARRSSFIAPARWTVTAFTVSVGFLITTSLMAIFFSMWYKQPQISAFGPLNTFKVEMVRGTQTGNPDLEAVVEGKSDKEVSRAAERLHIKLKQG